MDNALIETAADYAAALKKIDELMSAELGTTAGDHLKTLASVVEAYEAKHYPIKPTADRQQVH